MNAKTSWDFSLLLEEKDLPGEKERATSVSKEFIEKWKDRNDYLSSSKVLSEALSDYEEWQRTTGPSGKLGYYWSLKNSLDQASPEILANVNLVTDLATKIQNDIQFFEIKISKIELKTQKKFLAAPELLPYKHFLERLFEQAKYILSEPEERIMNLKANSSAAAWERMTSGLIYKEERDVLGQKKNFSEIYNLINDPDKKTRVAAAGALEEIMTRWVEVGEAEMNALLNDKKVNDQLRGMKSPEEGRLIADDMQEGVVNALISGTANNFHIPAKFYELKSKLLGVSKLEYYERSVPYGKIDKKYSYEEGSKLVSKVLQGLDPEFEDIFTRLSENGQVDAFPKKGKRGGAFCAHNLLVEPTYVLLNYDEKLENVLTLAHEFGHAINDELMRGQSAFYFHTSLATAEVASTFFEGFVVSELMEEADPELKLTLMIKQLDDDVGTIFRQVAMFMFERDLHEKFREKGYLSKEEIGKLWVTHAMGSMGEFVNKTPLWENSWLYVPHIREFFYVYSYASGQLISKALQAKVKKDPKFTSEVKKFLASGSSKSPRDLFMEMGIDIAKPDFWETGIKEIENQLKETEKLAIALKKTV